MADQYKTMAMVTGPGPSLEYKQVDTPKPGKGQLLVQVQYAAQNPTNSKPTTTQNNPNPMTLTDSESRAMTAACSATAPFSAATLSATSWSSARACRGSPSATWCPPPSGAVSSS